MRPDDRSMSNTLVCEVAVENGAEYRAMFRMEEADFDYLLNLVSPLIAVADLYIS